MFSVISVPEAATAILVSTQSYYRLAADSLLPPPIKISPNRSAVISHELNAVMIARSTGADDQTIKKLVEDLVQKRKNQTQK
jgi:predicted DNA-binding transcriptional regulator AlpA